MRGSICTCRLSKSLLPANFLKQGELSFERLLRVDGSFNGKLASNGDLVVGEKGVIRGNIIGLREVRKEMRIKLACVFTYHTVLELRHEY